MNIAYIPYPDLTALDLVGAHKVMSRLEPVGAHRGVTAMPPTARSHCRPRTRSLCPRRGTR
jgi:hypothetical protein